MKLRPGGVPWFLRHEILLFLYGNGFMNKAGERVRFPKSSIVVWTVVWLALHAFAFFVVYKLGDTNMPPKVMIAMTLALLFVFTLMLSSSLKGSVDALFERGDMDLLLSSPVSSLSIFTARLLGITLGVAFLFLFFLTPFAHAGLVLGHFRLLSIYPAVLGTSAVAASLSMLLTLGLVRTLGARRTRVVAQVLGALAGAAIFLASQAQSLMGEARMQALSQWLSEQMAPGALLGPASLAWYPTRALLGDAGPLLSVSVLAAASFFLTLRLTHRFFVRGLQEAASTSRNAARPAKPVQHNFRGKLFEVTVAKEWRLILRDPQLISQILLQLLYLVPMFAVVFTKPDFAVLPVLSAGLTMLLATLGSSLAWLTVLAEDAPDLLRSSPANQRTIRLAKLAAAAMPPLILAALPLLWLLATNPVSGALISFPVVASVVTAVLITQWRRRPAPRSNFTRRGMGDWASNILDLVNTVAWAAFAFMLLRIGAAGGDLDDALWGLAALGAALAVLLFAWFTRRAE